jgi:hypothetical protein
MTENEVAFGVAQPHSGPRRRRRGLDFGLDRALGFALAPDALADGVLGGEAFAGDRVVDAAAGHIGSQALGSG